MAETDIRMGRWTVGRCMTLDAVANRVGQARGNSSAKLLHSHMILHLLMETMYRCSADKLARFRGRQQKY